MKEKIEKKKDLSCRTVLIIQFFALSIQLVALIIQIILGGL